MMEEYQSDLDCDDDIFVDTVPLGAETKTTKPIEVILDSYQSKLPPSEKSIVDKMLGKATLSSDYDKKPIEAIVSKSNRAKRKERKAIRESTKGKKWYNMPATELNEENERDLKLLQIRSEIDPKSQYRRNDLKVLPKYFQSGTIVDNFADFYSSRLTKRERKRTMVDEWMSDYSFLAKSKQRYASMKAREALTKRRRINPMKRFSKKKK